MVSVIIPAYNEEKTIGAAVLAVVRHPRVSEVIVVDDGSTDGTAALAAEAGARVISLRPNIGKSGAMEEGVKAAKERVVLFLDADVLGLDHAKISRIIDPVLSGAREMYVGVRARTALFNAFFHWFPIIGGERALTKELWRAVPRAHKRRFQIEIALNYQAKQTEKGMGFELVEGVRHHIKEVKYGFRSGLRRRASMVKDVVLIAFGLYVLGFLYKAFPPLQRFSKVELNR